MLNSTCGKLQTSATQDINNMATRDQHSPEEEISLFVSMSRALLAPLGFLPREVKQPYFNMAPMSGIRNVLAQGHIFGAFTAITNAMAKRTRKLEWNYCGFRPTN
jgi:hypothetical protein